MNQAYAKMCLAPWEKVAPVASTMPPHDASRAGTPLDTYDAYKYCADWDGSRFTQNIYAGCVCYSIKLPKDAWKPEPTPAAGIASVKFNVAADRWIGAGCRAFAALSADEAPSIRPDAIMAATPPLPQTGAILAQEPPANTNAPQNIDVSIPLDYEPAPPPQPYNPATYPFVKYLHIYLVLENYQVNRGAWVEGSATLDYSSVAIDYRRAVVDDDLPEEPEEPEVPPTPPPLQLPVVHGVYAFQMPAMTNVLTMVDANHANRRFDARLGFTTGIVTSRTEVYLSLNPTSGTSGVRFGVVGGTSESMGNVVYGFAGAVPGKRITGIMLPWSIPKPAWFAFRLVAYFLGMPDTPASGLARDCLTTLANAELADPKLWAGAKTAAHFVAPANASLVGVSRPMVCALNRVFHDPVSGSASSPVQIPGINYVPTGAFLQLILLLSPAYPTDSSPSTDGTVSWIAADISNAKILQEP